MKKNFLMLVAFISLYVVGQKKEDIAPEVTKMINATNQLDFETVMDYTYPVIFDFAPKEMLVDIMKESMDNDMMKITFEEIETKTTISAITEINDGFYALVTFPSKMNMTFKNELPDGQIDVIKESMKMNMNADRVEFIKDINTLQVTVTSKTIAIFDKYTEKKWKFLNYQEGQKEQMLMILNEEVFNALGL